MVNMIGKKAFCDEWVLSLTNVKEQRGFSIAILNDELEEMVEQFPLINQRKGQYMDLKTDTVYDYETGQDIMRRPEEWDVDLKEVENESYPVIVTESSKDNVEILPYKWYINIGKLEEDEDGNREEICAHLNEMEMLELWNSDLIDYFLAHTDWREELWELKAQIMKDTFGEDSDAYKNFIKTRWNAGDGFG